MSRGLPKRLRIRRLGFESLRACHLVEDILKSVHRIFSVAFADIYPSYVAKVERKGRSVDELRAVIHWLTGFDDSTLDAHIESKATLRQFFDAARMNPSVDQITGVVCGVRVEDIEDPLMRKIRYLDKLVDELAKGKSLEKVLRTAN